ncbi:MAG: hypothetical protein ABGW92_02055, partial [Methanocaldococcus sp.]
FVNKSTVDYENAKILMDNLYSSREINVNGNNVTVVIKDIDYIPAKNKLEIDDNDKKLIIEFSKDDNDIKYDDIYYIIELDFKEGDEVSLFNKSYIVEDINSKYIILKEKEGKEIVTNKSFEYDGYKVDVNMVSDNLDTIVVDIYKDGKILKKMLKLNKGEGYYVEGGTLEFVYENCTKKGRRYYFTFKAYSTIKIEEDKDYPLDGRFRVKEINKNDKIELEYKDVNKLGKKLSLFNYTIIPENIYEDYVLFKIIKASEKKVKVEDYAYIDDGIYAIKRGGEIYIYYKGKKIENHEKIYLGLVDCVDNNPLNVDKDIILIGGSKVNKFVRELENMGLLKVNITNKYPGDNIGVIQKIKNPYNDNNNIYILAGSNRWGTKAAILVFLTKYKGEDILKVEWKDGEVKVLK